MQHDYTGEASILGFGLENTRSTLVTPQHLVDFRTESLTGHNVAVKSQARRGRMRRRIALPGKSWADGGVVMEVTPQSHARLLYGFCNSVSVAGGNDPYTHTFDLDAGEPIPMSWHVKRAGMYYAYAGMYVNELAYSITAGEGDDHVLICEAALAGHGEAIYNSSQMGAAAYDADGAMVFTRAYLSLDGGSTQWNDAFDASWRIVSASQSKTVLRDSRHEHGRYDSSLTIEGDITLYFASESERLEFMGIDSSAASYPEAPSDAVRERDIHLRFQSDATGTGNRQLLFDFPLVTWEDGMNEPIAGPEAIEQTIPFSVRYDSSTKPIITIETDQSDVTGLGSNLGSQPTWV